MEIPQLDTTNVFLGIIASLAVVQMVAAVVAIVWMKRVFTRLSEAAARLETTYVQPIVRESLQLAQQSRQTLAEVQSVVGRAQEIVGGVEAGTHHALTALHAVNNHVETAVHTGISRLRAFEHGVRRGVQTLVHNATRR
jgi:hypothetical protein